MAKVAILNHRKTTDGGVRPWEALGVSERRYYKLLNRFAPRPARDTRSTRTCWKRYVLT